MAAPAADGRTLAAPGQYLSFALGGESYGIDIMKVQEIRSYETPTRMPNTTGFLLGVVNLRGVVVPIIDLRLRFACPSAEITPSTVVIVIDLGDRVVGVVVDAVRDVVTLEADMVRAAPGMSATLDANAISGLAQVGERMLILLDIEALLGDVAPVDGSAA
ncbi:chemotaxis protein CheW [Paracidovorax sp. MALMAid1276]|uniref:chemotaxis protein CheW n=1 Tax=Paracidovorax sp. MALMAid1276 TaxID=3411631 RepID=UPI003B9CB78B